MTTISNKLNVRLITHVHQTWRFFASATINNIFFILSNHIFNGTSLLQTKGLPFVSSLQKFQRLETFIEANLIESLQDLKTSLILSKQLGWSNQKNFILANFFFFFAFSSEETSFGVRTKHWIHANVLDIKFTHVLMKLFEIMVTRKKEF